MKNLKMILLVSAAAMLPASAIAQTSLKSTIAGFAEPYGIEKGTKTTIYVPPSAHVSEIIVYFDESVDAINGIQVYYQPNLDSGPVATNSVGQLVGKQIRISVDWNDVFNGLEVETSPAGALASFILTTEKGAKRGFKSTLANGKSRVAFGKDLQFAGLTVRADKQRVYAMGLNLVPAKSSSNNGGLQIYSADDDSRNNASSRPAAPQKGGFAQAMEEFAASVSRGRRDREFEEDQERLRREQQAYRNRQATSTKYNSGNNRITSPHGTSPRLGGFTKVILYEHCNFTGKAIGLHEGEWTLANLSRYGMRNDSISSIKILSGHQIDAYSNDHGAGGVKKTFTRNVACLTNYRFNDVLSYATISKIGSSAPVRGTTTSYRPPAPVKRPTTPARPNTPRLGGNNKVILYQHCNYGGKALGVYEGGWSMTRMAQLGMPNDQISSIKVLPGYRVEAYQHDGAKGIKKTFDSSISCLVNHSFNDTISYVRVKKKPALRPGQSPNRGTTARGPEQLAWTPAGVTGYNVGAAYYDRYDSTGKMTQYGRFEITKEGSNIWNWFVMGSPGSKRRWDPKKPLAKMRVVSRSSSSVTLQDMSNTVHKITINTRTKKITGMQDNSHNGRPPSVFFNGKVTTQSRPK